VAQESTYMLIKLKYKQHFYHQIHKINSFKVFWSIFVKIIYWYL